MVLERAAEAVCSVETIENSKKKAPRCIRTEFYVFLNYCPLIARMRREVQENKKREGRGNGLFLNFSQIEESN